MIATVVSIVGTVVYVGCGLFAMGLMHDSIDFDAPQQLTQRARLRVMRRAMQVHGWGMVFLAGAVVALSWPRVWEMSSTILSIGGVGLVFARHPGMLCAPVSRISIPASDHAKPLGPENSPFRLNPAPARQYDEPIGPPTLADWLEEP